MAAQNDLSFLLEVAGPQAIVYGGSDIEELVRIVNSCVPTIKYELTIASGSVTLTQDIREKFIEARNLVNKSGETSNPERFREVRRCQELQDDINKSLQNIYVSASTDNKTKLLIEGEDMKNTLSVLTPLIRNLTKQKAIQKDFLKPTSTHRPKRFSEPEIFKELKKLKATQTIKISVDFPYRLCLPPDEPKGLLGFDEHVMKLKELLLLPPGGVVVVTAIGGAGKSTLATALCYDPQIREHFEERIIYIGGKVPYFIRLWQARIELERQIKSRNQPILMVLDDIREYLDLRSLLCELHQCTTLVTARDENVIRYIPLWRDKVHYRLPSLQGGPALSLFCQCAFGKSTIPDTHDEELVKQVQAKCKGLPLALQVIGSSLNGEPDSVWEATRDALAKGEATDENQIEALLKRLETSIDVLSPSEKQCFLDLAVFPIRRSIPANVLLDIWVYVRRMRRNEAVGRLRKFGDCHLLDLKRDPRTPESTDDCMNSYSFSQQ